VDETDVRRRDDDVLEAGFVDGAHGVHLLAGCDRNEWFVSWKAGRFNQAGMRIIDFYDHHPISEGQVLDAVRRVRGGRDATLTADDLFPSDQDHDGGLGAVDMLARRAGITARSRV